VPRIFILTSVLLTGAVQADLAPAPSDVSPHEASFQVLPSWVSELAGKSEFEQVALVNDELNQFSYIRDEQQWGQEDYWATPSEFFLNKGGDCEDFSLTKYLILRAAGVPADRLRLTYVRSLEMNEAHMVLSYLPADSSETYYLDNLRPELATASQRLDLVPFYSFSDDNLWLYDNNGWSQKFSANGRLNKWNDFQARLLSQ
tara:strand:+ start:13971 stop:14576 length:606 start_codon:yes stop_codon:yes gene_type:complete